MFRAFLNSSFSVMTEVFANEAVNNKTTGSESPPPNASRIEMPKYLQMMKCFILCVNNL